MSLFSLIASKFGSRYDKDSVILSSDFVREKLMGSPLFFDSSIYLKDDDYQGLQPSRLGEFIADNVWSISKTYKKEVFDCDDFAACARADILKAGAADDFKNAVFVAEVCYERVEGGYHAANLLMDSSGIIYLYEPQTGQITHDLSSKIKTVGEVWG